MGTLQSLSNKLDTLRRELSGEISSPTSIPYALGESMKQETKQNFEDEAYGNNGTKEKWPDRRLERLLKYPKLNYTGKLKRSFTTKVKRLSSKSANIILFSSSPYAQIQQEGLQGGGTPTRKPPYATKPLRLGTKPLPRKFMGIGKRSVANFHATISRKVRKIMSKF